MARHRLVIETDTSDENFARILARVGANPPPPPPADPSGDGDHRLAQFRTGVAGQARAVQNRLAAGGPPRRKRRPRGTRVYGLVMRPSGRTTVLYGERLRGARRARRLQARRRKARREAVANYVGETEKNLQRGWDWARQDGMSRVRTTADGLLARVTNKPPEVRRACGWMTGRRLALVALAVVTVVGACVIIRKRRARASEEAA